MVDGDPLQIGIHKQEIGWTSLPEIEAETRFFKLLLVVVVSESSEANFVPRVVVQQVFVGFLDELPPPCWTLSATG